MKTCSKCKENKPLDCYYKVGHVCKACKCVQAKKIYEANPEKGRARSRKWTQNNPEKKRAREKKYYEANPEKWKKRHAANRDKRNARIRHRRKTDPVFATTQRLRCRMRNWLRRGKKSASTQNLVGCTFKECKQWLENQFVDGMSWENRDKWHIDHMMPLKTFNVLDPEQQRIACHYTNLQPLWGPENISQGSKIVYDMIWREHWYIKIDGEYVSRLDLGRLGRTRSQRIVNSNKTISNTI